MASKFSSEALDGLPPLLLWAHWNLHLSSPFPEGPDMYLSQYSLAVWINSVWRSLAGDGNGFKEQKLITSSVVLKDVEEEWCSPMPTITKKYQPEVFQTEVFFVDVRAACLCPMLVFRGFRGPDRSFWPDVRRDVRPKASSLGWFSFLIPCHPTTPSTARSRCEQCCADMHYFMCFPVLELMASNIPLAEKLLHNGMPPIFPM